ncbi:hypothetical protein Sjap_019151 [Stephania japonica]|uniref:Endonuclease/exonuclease/phosphatase domain-containing protein n=1 Tax=Stephania japonica TaxID=461633 RepID=A0AAP0F3Q6_9MAGN
MFKLLQEECIEFNKFGLRDNVAQICVLESRNQNHAVDGSGNFPSSSNEGNRVVVCNIHVLYNPKRGEIKLGQVRMLLERAFAVSSLWNDAPVVLCGDFNCTPKSPLYNFISEQKLNLTELGRDQISGQSSGQLFAPERYGWSPGNHTNRNPSPNNQNGASLPRAEKNFDVMHNNPIQTGNTPPANNFMKLQSDSMPQDMSNKSYFDVNSKCENTKSGATIEEKVEDVNGIEPSSSHCIPIGSPSSSHSEGMIPVDSQSGLSNGYTGHSFHRSCTRDSSSTIDHTSQVVASEEKESSNFFLEKENSCGEASISFSGNGVEFDEAANASISETSPALQSDAFFHEEIKASPPINFENITCESAASEDNDLSSTSANCAYQVGESYASASVDLDVDKKLFDLSLIDVVDAKSRTESIGEDLDQCTTLPSESQPTPPSDEVQIEKISSASIDYGIANAEKNSYDPYLWTPMEIQTASGNAECTTIEHPLKLRSTYAEVEDYSGTRDLNKEPLVTSYNRRFMGTVDYIWCSDGLQTVKVLDTLPKQAMQWTPGFPTPKWGSDHLALASQLAFTKKVNQL